MQVTTAGTGARELDAFASELAKLKQRIEAIETGMRTGGLGNSSIEDGYLSFYDEAGRERARIGKQPDGSYAGGQTRNNNIPPAVPNDPVAEPVIAGIRVKSTGPSSGTWPSDLSHLNVWMADGPGLTGRIVGSIIGGEGVFVIAPLAAGSGPYRIWLTSVNTSKAESAPSLEVTASPLSVVGQDILDGAINELHLANEAVTAAKIAAGAVGTEEIAGQAVDLSKLADGSVSAAQLIEGAVETEKIAAEAIVSELIAANAIIAGKIAASAVTAETIAAGAVEAEKIAAEAISADKIAANAVTADKILALAITSDKIAANAVTAGMIQAGAITAAKLEADMVLASRIIAGTANGARSEIHPTDGFQAFDAEGIKVAQFGGIAGTAMLKGTVVSGDGVGFGRTIVVDGASAAMELHPDVAAGYYVFRAWNAALLEGGTGPVLDLYAHNATGVQAGPYLRMEEPRGLIWLGFRSTGGDPFFGSTLRIQDNGVAGVFSGIYDCDISIDQTGEASMHAAGQSMFVKQDAVGITGPNGTIMNMHPTGETTLGFVGQNYIAFFPNGTTNVAENGAFKAFVIDHPDDPENRYLVHGCTESPHAGVEYWGTATVVDGIGEVELPSYFESLTHYEDRVVIVTPILPTLDRPRPTPRRPLPPERGPILPNGKELPPLHRDHLIPHVAATYPRNGRFQLQAGRASPRVFEVNWTVKAVRKDVARNSPEPRKDAVSVSGDGPYRYIA